MAFLHLLNAINVKQKKPVKMHTNTIPKGIDSAIEFSSFRALYDFIIQYIMWHYLKTATLIVSPVIGRPIRVKITVTLLNK